MKFNFYPAVFLLITIVPILIIRPQSQEAGIAEFVRSKHNVGERDTIKLYALESGLETEYKEFDFSRNVVKFIEDTLYMRFNTVGY